jgi:predicted phosphodiesterase
MLIQIISDLHLNLNNITSLDDYIIKKEADTIILNGDIGSLYNLVQLENFLTIVCKMFKIVIYVFGNHEFYYNKQFVFQEMDKLKKGLYIIKSKLNNMYILDRNCIKINNVCIIGCTLWTYIKDNQNIPKFKFKIPDMNNNKYKILHKKDLRYIKKMIKYCNKHNLKIVIASHYPPLNNLTDKPDSENIWDYMYKNNLDYLINNNNINTWIYGHTHHNKDFITPNGTRIVSNQLGKITESVSNFSTTKIIDIK